MHLFLADVVDSVVARVTGPMSFRFALQPAVAVFLGIRDGLMDAKAGTPPFIEDLVFRPKDRKRQLKSALHRLLVPIVIGTVLDMISQYLIFKDVKPLVALWVGGLVMGVPYTLARGLSNRIVTACRRGRSETPQE